MSSCLCQLWAQVPATPPSITDLPLHRSLEAWAGVDTEVPWLSLDKKGEKGAEESDQLRVPLTEPRTIPSHIS